MASLRALDLVASAFQHALASPGSDVGSLGDSDWGVGAHVERFLSTAGALEEVCFVRAARFSSPFHSAPARSCPWPTRRARGWSVWLLEAWFVCEGW